MNVLEKILKFNDNEIPFIDYNNQYYIAVKPVCEALGVDYGGQYKSLKRNSFLKEELQLISIKRYGVSGTQRRPMICIPQKYVYGWLFSIRGQSIEFQSYKQQLYHMFYEYFLKPINNRSNLLVERNTVDRKIKELKDELKCKSKSYNTIQDLTYKKRTLAYRLGSIDRNLINQKQRSS